MGMNAVKIEDALPNLWFYIQSEWYCHECGKPKVVEMLKAVTQKEIDAEFENHGVLKKIKDDQHELLKQKAADDCDQVGFVRVVRNALDNFARTQQKQEVTKQKIFRWNKKWEFTKKS